MAKDTAQAHISNEIFHAGRRMTGAPNQAARKKAVEDLVSIANGTAGHKPTKDHIVEIGNVLIRTLNASANDPAAAEDVAFGLYKIATGEGDMVNEQHRRIAVASMVVAMKDVRTHQDPKLVHPKVKIANMLMNMNDSNKPGTELGDRQKATVASALLSSANVQRKAGKDNSSLTKCALSVMKNAKADIAVPEWRDALISTLSMVMPEIDLSTNTAGPLPEVPEDTLLVLEAFGSNAVNMQEDLQGVIGTLNDDCYEQKDLVLENADEVTRVRVSAALTNLYTCEMAIA